MTNNNSIHISTQDLSPSPQSIQPSQQINPPLSIHNPFPTYSQPSNLQIKTINTPPHPQQPQRRLQIPLRQYQQISRMFPLPPNRQLRPRAQANPKNPTQITHQAIERLIKGDCDDALEMVSSDDGDGEGGVEVVPFGVEVFSDGECEAGGCCCVVW